MGWVTLAGPVTGVREMDDVAQYKYLAFRISDRPVTSYLKMHLMDNDTVTAVGWDEKTPELRIEALRNDKTKVIYAPEELPVKFPVFGIIFGIILIPFFFIGVFILFSSWVGYTNSVDTRNRARELHRLLNAAPSLANK